MEQGGDVDPDLLHSIRRLEQQHGGNNKLSILFSSPVNRRSVQYLVDFLRGDSHQVTELELRYFALSEPSDGSVEILRDFFINDTKLTRVMNLNFNFGGEQETIRLLEAFETNATLRSLTIGAFHLLKGAALGACLSRILQNNSHLEEFSPYCDLSDPETLRAIQPGLQSNRTLKVLCLRSCRINAEGFRLIAAALAGNTVLETWDISSNSLNSSALVDLTRSLQSMHLRRLEFYNNRGHVFDDNAATRRFFDMLSRNNHLKKLSIPQTTTSSTATTLTLVFKALESNITLEEIRLGGFLPHEQCRDQLIESLPRMKGLKKLFLMDEDLYWCVSHTLFLPALNQNTSLEVLTLRGCAPSRFRGYDATLVAPNKILARNKHLHHADSLLALQRSTGRPIDSKSGIWYKAFAKMSTGHSESGNDSHTGASAIFKVFQTRPAILEKQLLRPRPPIAVAAAAVTHSHQDTNPSAPHHDEQDCSPNCNNDDDMKPATAASASSSSTTSGQKRRRLE